ncbi:MBL fold metallo-hydrolase [candidate division KSB1 bacterium]
MHIRFWGVRGSIATPEKNKLKYGGNTTCFEINDDDGNILIFDAGSGIRKLGKELKENNDKKLNLFFSHYHWDHTQGLPFFAPMFNPESEIIMHGAKRGNIGTKEALSGQLSRLYFPVPLDKMPAKKDFLDLKHGEIIEIGNNKIHSRNLNHPQGCLGYRIENGDKVITICTDTEHMPGKLSKDILTLAENSDLFIYDCNYTTGEYLKGHQGWGHSTAEEGIKLAKEANVKKFVLCHHDPDHIDDFLDKMVVDAKKQFPDSIGAMEGQTIEI